MRSGAACRTCDPAIAVVLNWCIPCGECFQCRRGETVLCETSRPAHVMERSRGHAHAEGTRWRGQPIDRSFNIGTLSGLTLVRKEAVTRMPDGVPFPVAAITGCGVMTGVGSALNVAQVQPGESVAVLGCGGVGLNVIQGARLAGASTIIAIDTNPVALARARQFGATHVVGRARRKTARLRTCVAAVRALTGRPWRRLRVRGHQRAWLAFVPLLLVRDGGTGAAAQWHQRHGAGADAVVHVEQALRHAPLRRMPAGAGLPAHLRALPGQERCNSTPWSRAPTNWTNSERRSTTCSPGRNAKGVIVMPDA